MNVVYFGTRQEYVALRRQGHSPLTIKGIFARRRRIAALDLDFKDTRSGASVATKEYPFGVTVVVRVESDWDYSPIDWTDGKYEDTETSKWVVGRNGKKRMRSISVLTEGGRQFCEEYHEYPPHRLPYRDHDLPWYTSGFDPFERRDYNSKAGMARHEAWVKAWQACRDESDLYAHLQASTVSISVINRSGTTAAYESLGGIDYSEYATWRETWDTLYEVIDDLYTSILDEIDSAIQRAAYQVAEHI